MQIGSDRLRLALLDELPDGLCVLSESFVVVFWNRRIEEWTGIERAEVIGTDLRQRFPELAHGHGAVLLRSAFAGEPSAEARDGAGLVGESFADGRPAHLCSRALPFQALDVCRYALLQLRDVGDSDAQQQALARERELRQELEGRVKHLSAQLVLEKARFEERLHELEKALAARPEAPAAEIQETREVSDRAPAGVSAASRLTPTATQRAPGGGARPRSWRRIIEDLSLR